MLWIRWKLVISSLWTRPAALIIISDLVGIAIAGVLDDPAQVFFAAPKSPNLYLGLHRTPTAVRTTCGRRSNSELTLPERVFPMLKDPEHAQHSPVEWADIVSHAYFTLSTVSHEPAAEKA